jgi:UDP-glucose 4-epimerase
MIMTEKKQILVTGGSGFIGSNLVDFLVLQGHSVLVIDDLSTGIESNHNKSVTYLKIDLCRFIDHPDELVEILRKYEISTVYHLAASADVYLSINNPEKVYKINLLSSIALARACKKTGIKKFIFASTSAVFGEPEYLPVDEQHVSNPISPYGLSKLGFEQYLNYFSIDSEMSIIVFRLPNVYGLRQRPDLEGGVVAIFYDLMKQGKPVTIFGDGKQTRDWVYVEDIVNAFFKALSHQGNFQIFLLGSDTETSLNNLFECLKDITNYEGTPNYMDERAGDIKNMVMSFTEASEVLDWKPKVTLSQGVNKLIEGF